jgi:hypothetical protein
MVALAEQLTEVPGIVAVTLGGSRARGTHTDESDVDLGLYYRNTLDTRALGALAKQVSGPNAQVTEPGEWGPWVDGGAWLTIGGQPVDWIYRDLDRVEQAWLDAQAGRYRFHAQAGHPLGFPDFAYAGEVALGVILVDPGRELTTLQQATAVYPPALTEALISGLWEADFLLGVARKAVTRRDVSYVAGCMFRLVGVCMHALHGAAGQWLINEKGAVKAEYQDRVNKIFGELKPDPLRLTAAIDQATDLVLDTADACAMMAR